MSSAVVQKFFSTVEKTTVAWLSRDHHEKNGIGELTSGPSLDNTCSCWSTVPVELQLSIFVRCGIQDLRNLRLVSRGFRDLIDFHESNIAREYLRLRRHGSLPSPIHDIYPKRPQSHADQQQLRKHHTLNPEDDVILLSDLFPPCPPGPGSASDTYTLGYLQALRCRQEDCQQVAYYLADSVLETYVHSDPALKASFASKRDRQFCRDRGVAMLQHKLTPLMFYLLYFLEMFHRRVQDVRDTLYAAHEAGSLPTSDEGSTLDEEDARSESYRQVQKGILQRAPFTDTRILISTHHCMTLLIRYIRHGFAPEPPFYSSNDTLISMMLSLTPGLKHVVRYFAAEKGAGSNNRRAMRREFIRNIQADWDAARRDVKARKVYGLGADSLPQLGDIWFEAASKEIRTRGVERHRTDDRIELWEGAPAISIGCQFCEAEGGWWA